MTSGAVRRGAALGAACLAAAAVLVSGCGGGGDEGGPALYCYVGGTMRPAMEELARLYQADTGRRVELDYGDSGSNLIKAEATRRGDLYVAHDPFHGAMERKQLSVRGWTVATLEPVIAVARGNPKGIGGLKDLARPGLRLVLTDADYSTVGHINAIMFGRAGLANAIEKNVATRTKMGGEAANAVILGHADATIVWNAVVHLRSKDLEAVPIEPAYRPDPTVDAVTSATYGPIDMSAVRVTVDVLRSSRRPEEARAFAEFCASPRARQVWRSFGFGPPPAEGQPAPGEPPAASPDEAPAPGGAPAAEGALLLYCGAGLRPAMDEMIPAFTARTGVAVACDYGGSGMIISRLRLAGRGDLFMPGDVWYVELAEQEGLVASKAMVCYFVPVILVPKGNPKRVRSLADLARPGVRLGLGNPKACQVGRASEAIFAKNGIPRDAIDANLLFSSTTVNELGLQVVTGHLDAAIVWDAVAAQYADRAEVVAIPPEQNETSRVAVAVLKASRNRKAAEAFVQFLLSSEGQAVFRKHQYRTDPPS
jgi:molybdate transport system substrate-binding protein